MDIKFKKLEKVTGESRGKVWTAFKIIGTKLEDGTEWESTNIFQNAQKLPLLDELRELESGEKIAVKHQKNDKGYWEVVEIGEVEDDASKNSGAGRSSGNTGGRGLTKEEWAKKDADTQKRISRAVALKAAVDNTKIGTKPEALIEMAEELMPYLMGEELPVGGEDGLEPPEV